MTHAYAISFDLNEDVSADDRQRLKAAIAKAVRETVANGATLVAVDHLDAPISR